MVFEANISYLATKGGNWREEIKEKILDGIKKMGKQISGIFFKIELPIITVQINNPEIAPADVRSLLEKNFGDNIQFIWKS